MYFLQSTTIKPFTYHLFSQTFLCVPFTSCLFEKITHHPPRAACLLHEHICLSRTSSIFYVSALNDFVADNCINILYVSIFDCSGFLRAREYHFLSEAQKNRLEWTKLEMLFLRFFWTVFGVCFCVVYTNSV